MKHGLNILVWALALSAGSISLVSAVDLTTLSNDEMTQMRSQINLMSSADRANYQNEMQIRMKLMNSDELAAFRQDSGITAQTPGYRINSTAEPSNSNTTRSRDSRGSGKGKGKGNGNGQGKQLRDGSGSGSGYGQGRHDG